MRRLTREEMQSRGARLRRRARRRDCALAIAVGTFVAFIVLLFISFVGLIGLVAYHFIAKYW